MYLIFKKINKIKVMSEFNQLCVLQGTIMPDGGAKELENFFKEQMDVTVKFETQVKTLPDTPDCTETGGRNDLFFYTGSNIGTILIMGYI
jgi:hypothetical protein